MGWSAHLIDDRGHEEGEWSYTSNTHRMAHEAIADHPTPVARPHSWSKELDGMTGPEGAAFLNRIITCLEADPERFRAMNPESGWGDYDSFVEVLIAMRNAVPEWPTTWRVYS